MLGNLYLQRRETTERTLENLKELSERGELGYRAHSEFGFPVLHPDAAERKKDRRHSDIFSQQEIENLPMLSDNFTSGNPQHADSVALDDLLSPTNKDTAQKGRALSASIL